MSAASSPEFGTSGTEKSERTAFLQDNADKSQAFPQSAANEQDVYADSILSSDELRQMFMQREYTSRDVERLLISHAALINKVKWLESKP